MSNLGYKSSPANLNNGNKSIFKIRQDFKTLFEYLLNNKISQFCDVTIP